MCIIQKLVLLNIICLWSYICGSCKMDLIYYVVIASLCRCLFSFFVMCTRNFIKNLFHQSFSIFIRWCHIMFKYRNIIVSHYRFCTLRKVFCEENQTHLHTFCCPGEIQLLTLCYRFQQVQLLLLLQVMLVIGVPSPLHVSTMLCCRFSSTHRGVDH